MICKPFQCRLDGWTPLVAAALGLSSALNAQGQFAGSFAHPGGVRNSQGWLTGTATLNNNAWHFITITVSAGVKTIYTNWQDVPGTSATNFVLLWPSNSSTFFRLVYP